MAQTYYFLAASDRFLQGHQAQEVLEERTRHYLAHSKAIDFWLVRTPAFLAVPEFADLRHRCPAPAAAVVSTDGQFILWLKHRLQYVLLGQFEAPSAAIPDPLAVHTAAR
ncbi:MgPME-cyclase complex family protein [Gloeobacter violaceus]|uniref:Ycf54 protein n=1 Tax=Gloeobacter violaceus (strain ATCC 29082 / PCC 7421) TaxID=251221 RepID=Q7NM85_GLOVI|nr:MgPME-cyclase complex family protein [Gloeobacter violaceus]BAC88823.1 ycf54 [Gloeobacter violaceus PCC 7421]